MDEMTQLYVCGDTSWWTGQALKLEHSYTPTSHAQRQMRRSSFPQFAGVGVWLVLGSRAGHLHQWRLAAVG